MKALIGHRVGCPFVFALLALLVLPAAVGGWGGEGNAGLRRAERLDEGRVRLWFGPGFSDHKLGQKAAFFQVLSAEDGDFALGVGAAGVKVVRTEPDGVYPAGWQGPVFHRHVVDIALPAGRRLRPGYRYWVRVQASSVVGQNARAVWIGGDGGEEEADSTGTDPTGTDPSDGRYGLREAYVLSPQALHLVTGPGLDLGRLRDRRGIVVTSDDDEDFSTPVHPLEVGRRSHHDFYIPDGWPWKARARHELFLLFPHSFKEGKTYTLRLNGRPGAPLVGGRWRWVWRRDDRRDVNLALKVNQLGYLSSASKRAYLGMWAGDLNAYDFSPYLRGFEVRRADDHKAVLRGAVTLRQKATYRLVGGRAVPDPKQVKGPETVYGRDLSYEDVYEIDFSALRLPGRYYIALPGMGRSLEFEVGEGVYTPAWKTLMNGLFHQRCGLALGAPWTPHFRPACHRRNTELSTAPSGLKNPFKRLPEFATDGRRHDLYGGHHDAGDWNPRAHIGVAETLMLLYELNPAAFGDGQLRIPEAGNGLPDVLDEAWWALDLWTRLQDVDGGVRAGIESAGDPREGDWAPTDGLREFAYAKEARASYRFAAAAAQAARLWAGLGRSAEADELLERARRAWDWAEAHKGRRAVDWRLLAAASLLRTTGEAGYGAVFEAQAMAARRPQAPLERYGKYDQILASYHYARSRESEMSLRDRIVAAFEREFRHWEKAARTTAYRHMREPYAPSTWGTGGLPIWLRRPALTAALTGDADLRRRAEQWIRYTCDFSLGSHPLNLVFTVGLGQRSVTSAWHYFMLGSPVGLIPGLQSEAAGGRWVAGQPAGSSMGNWPVLTAYPPGPWPELYRYSEGVAPATNEGLTLNQAKTAFAYGLLLPPLAEP